MARLLLVLAGGGWLLLALLPIHTTTGAITELTVGATSASTLMVSWTWDYTELNGITYLVSWYLVDEELGNASTKNYSYVVTGLTDCTNYSVTVKVKVYGNGESSYSKTFLKEPFDVQVGKPNNQGDRHVTWKWRSGSEVELRDTIFVVTYNAQNFSQMEVTVAEEMEYTVTGAAREGNVCVMAKAERDGCVSECNCTSYTTPTDKTGLIVGLSVGIPLGLLALAAIVYLVYRCRRHGGTGRNWTAFLPSTKSKKAGTSSNVPLSTINTYSSMNPEATLRTRFQAVFSTTHSLQNTGGGNYTTKAAERHLSKNRYTDILPYDQTLVKLKNVEYINASYVLGESGFIATQDPYPDQDDDFWQLLWECDVRVVVRLSTDSVTQATARYIDDHGDNSWVMGHEELRVTLVGKQNNSMFYKRTLKVVKDTMVRTIEHFHLPNWTINSAASREHVVRLVLAAKEAKQRLGSGSPVLVHCGAGVGRTGTFISIWHLMESQQQCTPETVEATVKTLRKSRMSMVQTEEQYVFIYNCVFDYKNNPQKWDDQADLYEMPS